MAREQQRQHVRISRADWQLAKRIAWEDYGMRLGPFIALLVRNWSRKRWPLEVIPSLSESTKGPKVLRSRSEAENGLEGPHSGSEEGIEPDGKE